MFLSNLTYWKNLTWKLKSSSLTRFEIHRKRNLRGVRDTMATIFPHASFVSAAWHCFFYSRLQSILWLFFLQSLSWPKWPVRGNCVQPLPSDSVFSPLPIHLQSKENKFGIWSPMTGLDVRCRSGCRSPPTWNTLKTVEAQN